MGDKMDEKALRLLEFDKILKKLEELASTALGKEKVQELTPTSDYATIEQWLKDTSDALALLWRKGNPPMGGISDVRSPIKRVELGAILSCAELLRVAGFLRGTRLLKQFMTNDIPTNWDTNTMIELGKQLTPNKGVEDEISRCILSDDEVADHASPELNSIRRNIKSKQDSIKERLNNILRSSDFKKVMQDAVVTMRGDRYVIPVKQEFKNLFSL